MIVSELLANKVQSILGMQYKVMPFHQFHADYTTPSMQGGYDISYQAFEEDGNVIPVTVSAAEISLAALPYAAKSCTYDLTFSVPIDFLKTDENGVLLEPPKFNFFGDYKKLYSAVNDAELTFEDGETEYKGYMTISEPSYIGKERTGSYERAIYRIIGNISITELDVGLGADVKISLSRRVQYTSVYVEHFLSNITQLSISSATDSNASQLAGNLGTQQESAAKGQVIQFNVPDIILDTNWATQVIRDKAFKNIGVLSPNEPSEDRKRKIRVKLYKKDILMSDFFAVLTVDYGVEGKTGFGAYRVALINDEKEV